MRTISYLSEPCPVSMAKYWHGITSLDHFWMRRRFSAFSKLLKSHPLGDTCVEIGCGQGYLQHQIHSGLHKTVDGFDLDEVALQQNISLSSSLFLYNIYDKFSDYRERFDSIIMFDVLEHIEDDSSFVDAALFHLKPHGRLYVNVPAHNLLFSDYDRHGGHLRRYSIKDFSRIALENDLSVLSYSYWGMPYFPILLLRKYYLQLFRPLDPVASGFVAGPAFIDNLLFALGSLEIFPQHFFGTSLMLVFAKL